MPNRLAQETSPYLRQHQDNPVDWYAWGPEALERAKREDKPIHLSVGYSACHWCHVMAHESFENAETAKLMNDRFVNIKVDREERPDLDQIYQNVAQVFTRGGGWPLTVFLTPELKPFFGGTYFPPEDKYGRPGFPRVVVALSDAYKNDRATVAENAEKIMDAIRSLETVGGTGKESPHLKTLGELAEALLMSIDWTYGGIGHAPKFPNTMTLTFLWRMGLATGHERTREAAVLALVRMAQGGIYDQLGGGFSRYSVDERWAVPHFEKMLYDNGLLLKLYSEVLLTDGDSSKPLLQTEQREMFARVVSETTAWLLREMCSPDGGFYAAFDADSEGEEGKFYVWDLKDLKNHLTEEEARAFSLRYGVTEAGNFEHGKTVLYLANEIDASARPLIESAKKKLFSVRSGRVPPGRDDKILTGWNGLAISGLAWAAEALREAGRPEEARTARAAALRAFRFIRERAGKDGDRLYGTIQEGKPRFNAYLDDYAFLSLAALDLGRFSPDSNEAGALDRDAHRWITTIQRHFKDAQAAGFFFTSDDHEALIQRPKTIYDQAIPSGTAVTLECMAALVEIDPDGKGVDLEPELGRQLESLFADVKRAPHGYGELLSAALLRLLGPVVVSGAKSHQAVRHSHVFQKEGDSRILICHRKVCGLPLSSPAEARVELAGKIVATR